MGGTWIANLKWSGVSLKILLEDAKVNPGANAVLLTGYDNWVPPISLDIAMHPDTLLAMKVNDQALSDELGGPVKLIPDARPGAFWVNRLKTVEVTELPTASGASKDGQDGGSETCHMAQFRVFKAGP